MIKAAKSLKPQKYPLSRLNSANKKSLKEHEELYHGYVKNYNKILQLLEGASSKDSNIHHSDFGELKRRFTWAHNGVFLHQMYFENLGGKNSTPNSKARRLIKEDFGTVKNFQNDLLDSGKVPPVGWVVWGYSALDEKTHIVVIEQHHNSCPIGFFPLLVLDLFEHSYYLQYQTDRASFLKATWDDINWDVIENRVKLLLKCMKVKIK